MPAERVTRMMLCLCLCLGLATASCSHPLHVLTGPPPVAYRTVGMLSGQGENESSAIAHVLDQAGRMDADAVIVENRRPVGQVIIVTCRVIKYLGPPPQGQ